MYTRRVGVVLGVIICLLLFQNCSAQSPGESSEQQPEASPSGWDISKSSQSPTNELPSIFSAPFRQPNSTLAWEDGAYISRDGLTLYAQYTQMDLYKGTVEDQVQNPNLYRYKRGPSIGQDLNPPAGLGLTNEWMHSDLVISSRATTNVDFPAWSLSNVKKSLFNDAAPQGVVNSADPSLFDLFVYTDDDTSTYAVKIRVLRNVPRNPTGPGSNLLSTAISAANFYDENPHIERYDSLDSNKLVLFFDSNNRNASLDIFFATSNDNGSSWSAVAPVTSVNSSVTEHQPHLFFDGAIWWLYLAATNPIDGKQAIFRYRQGTPGDWNSWQNKELVVSAGTSVGVGEPSLTSAGDLSFVTITQNTQNPSATDKYDADPWFMRRR